MDSGYTTPSPKPTNLCKKGMCVLTHTLHLDVILTNSNRILRSIPQNDQFPQQKCQLFSYKIYTAIDKHA